MRRAGLCLLVLLGCVTGSKETVAPNSTQASTPASGVHTLSPATLVRKALPSIVLIINNQVDGQIGYGSGILLDDKGTVLTNLHVVDNAKSLGGMLYDRRRISHIPSEGGLNRFLFEYHKDILPAHLVRGDPVLDLAVIQVSADTTKYARLPVRAEPVEPGEKVYAIGHPQQTVWSFTSGLVSALQDGYIQHEAAINHGNSGGALIDEQGRLVGINTSRLFGDTNGIGFARPIALAMKLNTPERPSHGLDLSTPEAAVQSCLQAEEQGRMMRARRCNDQVSTLQRVRKVVLDAAASKPDNESVAFLARMVSSKSYESEQVDDADGEREDEFLIQKQSEDRTTEKAIVEAHAEAPASPSLQEDDRIRKSIGTKLDEGMGQLELAVQAKALKRYGLKMNLRCLSAMADRLKMGTRIEDTRVKDDRAWVAMTGRNTDGTLFHWSELWVKRGAEWRRASVEQSDPTLPPGLVPPILQRARDDGVVPGGAPEGQIARARRVTTGTRPA